MILDQQGQLQGVTQTNSSSANIGAASSNSSSIVPQFQIAKVLLEDAIQSLQNNDTNKALIRLNLADQQISSSAAGNLSSAKITKVLLEDAIQSLQNNDTNKALIRLNLADQQIGDSNTTNIPSYSKRTTTVNETTATKFLKYENSTYGIKMQYPSDWRVESGNNSSVVALFFPLENNASNVTVDMSINNLTTSLTPDEYLNSLMRGDAGASKDFPNIQFTIHTTSNVVLAGHPGFLLVGTFKDPISGVLDGFSNIGTIIGDKAYSIQYYSPEQTYPVYSTIYYKMIKSFEVTLLTYDNSTYGIRVQYPPDWTVSGTNESRAVSSFVMFADFFSPSSGVAGISLGIETPANLTTNLNNYAQLALNAYRHFAAFKLVELNTTSTLAGKPAYTIVGTYQDPSLGPQKLMEVGTIIGGKVYCIQYIANEPRYSDYLSVVQGMIDSLAIKGSVWYGNVIKS